MSNFSMGHEFNQSCWDLMRFDKIWWDLIRSNEIDKIQWASMRSANYGKFMLIKQNYGNIC